MFSTVLVWGFCVIKKKKGLTLISGLHTELRRKKLLVLVLIWYQYLDCYYWYLRLYLLAAPSSSSCVRCILGPCSAHVKPSQCVSNFVSKPLDLILFNHESFTATVMSSAACRGHFHASLDFRLLLMCSERDVGGRGMHVILTEIFEWNLIFIVRV